MDTTQLQRLRELESENARLKKIVAQQLLDNDALKDLLEKNGRPISATRRRGLSA
jgi:putative transposase